MDRGAWWATVHGVTQELNMTGHTHTLVRHVGELSEPGISLMSFPAADAKRGNVWMQGHMHKKIKGSSRRNSDQPVR